MLQSSFMKGPIVRKYVWRGEKEEKITLKINFKASFYKKCAACLLP